VTISQRSSVTPCPVTETRPASSELLLSTVTDIGGIKCFNVYFNSIKRRDDDYDAQLGWQLVKQLWARGANSIDDPSASAYYSCSCRAKRKTRLLVFKVRFNSTFKHFFRSSLFDSKQQCCSTLLSVLCGKMCLCLLICNVYMCVYVCVSVVCVWVCGP